MHCDKCGFENPDGMRFCGQCATPLKLACPSCGFANPFDFEFCGQCATTLTKPITTNSRRSTPADNPRQTAPTTNSRQHDAERRQLTVLFCDMVGSSALSERIDPEELRDIMRDYRNTCSEIVDRYDGYVAQYLGDGVLVYFGYPHAHEDDAQRAALAAIDIVKRIPQHIFPLQQDEDIRLSVRVGVHTGLVVVGEMGGGDKRSMALGETPNIAARIQEHATSNSVVISNTTRQLLSERFTCQSLGKHDLKGFSHPIELFSVQQEHSNRTRFPKMSSPQHATLIGREQESALLIERLQQARKGVGQIVLLSGEPGLGKSRMVEMVCEKVAGEQSILVDCYGSPYYKNSFLHPIIDMMRRIVGLHEDLSSHEQIARIEQMIATLGMDTQTVTPVLAELLSIPLSATYNEEAARHISTPQQKKQKTLDVLVGLLQTMAQQRFVLLVVEDLQWVDHSTIELLSLLVDQPGLTNIFALFTYRSEFTPPWKGRVNLTQITLNRLTRKQSGSMIRQLCGGKTLPLEVYTEILNKTDGIPLFVEELANTVLRSTILIEKEDHFVLSDVMSQLGIPTTLQDSLMSRLDDLGADKELAQLSATLGREFTYELLHAASMQSDLNLQSGINRLINAELFFQQGNPPKSQYRFQHALLREAAYESLLKRTRQKYHQRIAALIKEKFPHIIMDNPEILAHHCTEAGIQDEALKYWLAAGRYAMQRSANIEAVAHLNNGLSIIQTMSPSPQLSLRELTFQTTLGLATMMSKGYAAPEAEKAYVRARGLCDNIEDTNTVFPVLCGLWEFYIVRANLTEAQKLADELDNRAEKSGLDNFTHAAKRILGTTQFWRGHFASALKNLETIFEENTAPHTESEELQSTLVAYSQDARVAALANAACVLWLLGETDKALEHGRAALDLAKRLSHPFSQAYALHFMGTLSQLCGDHKATYQYADAQIALSETYGFSFWAATGRMLKAWSESDSQPLDIICTQYQQALKDYENSGNRLARSYFHAILAELLQQANQPEQALKIIELTLQESSKTGEHFFTAELLRIKAELLMSTTSPENTLARELLQKSLAIAGEQGATALALRTEVSLAHCSNQSAIASSGQAE